MKAFDDKNYEYAIELIAKIIKSYLTTKGDGNNGTKKSSDLC